MLRTRTWMRQLKPLRLKRVGNLQGKLSESPEPLELQLSPVELHPGPVTIVEGHVDPQHRPQDPLERKTALLGEKCALIANKKGIFLPSVGTRGEGER